MIPVALLTDSYKLSHHAMYPPDATRMVAYAEFRQAYGGDIHDQRTVFHGIRYAIEHYVSRRWTSEDLIQMEAFLATHGPHNSAYPFPRELIRRIVEEEDGWLPVRIEALPEATVIYPHTPLFQIVAKGEWTPLVTWLESLLTMLIWYPSTVATLSRRCRDLIEAAFERSVEGGRDSPYLVSRLHDFGLRACTSPEQAMLGGQAHLLSWEGTDTLPAAYAAWLQNERQPVGHSIPASEHSVMTSHGSELGAIEQILGQDYGIVAMVMDTFHYERALTELLPVIKQLQGERQVVLRPDSGDPVTAVLAALQAIERVYGSEVNALGYKLPAGGRVSVIQGDGIDYATIERILTAVMEAGYSVQSVAFGMGGNLLQRLHRDTLSMATKLSLIEQGSVVREVCKRPQGDKGKWSMPGEFVVVRHAGGIPLVYPKGKAPAEGENLLQCWWDHGPVARQSPTFAQLKQELARQWRTLPNLADPLSPALRTKLQL